MRSCGVSEVDGVRLVEDRLAFQEMFVSDREQGVKEVPGEALQALYNR